jgi:hypothetical protein
VRHPQCARAENRIRATRPRDRGVMPMPCDPVPFDTTREATC